MRTARRLTVFRFAPCLLAVALLAVPALAEMDLEFRGVGDPQPTLGVITDDPGPFNRVEWASSVVSQVYILPEEDDRASAVEDPAVVRYNPVSGYPIAVWANAADVGAAGHDLLFSHFTVGGWTGPTRLAQGAADPTLAIDPSNGRVHLVYWMPADGGSVWHRHAPADLTSWTEPLRVSDVREAAARPTALVQDGVLTIAFESHVLGLGSRLREIVVVQRPVSDESSESRPTRTVLAMTSHEGRNWVRLDGDGHRLLVRWVASDHEAGWSLQEDSGEAWGPAGLVPFGPPQQEPAFGERTRGKPNRAGR